MSIILDNRASSNPILIGIMLIIIGFATLFVGSYIGYALLDSTNSLGDAATGTLTWSGNSNCGDWINVTNVAGTTANFYINVTGGGCAAEPSGYATVSIDSPYNTSTGTAANLTTAINANATINATMTAANPGAGVVTLTYNSVGDDANAVATTESSANATWSAATLTGGVDVAFAAQDIADYMGIALPLMGLALMITGFAVILFTIRSAQGSEERR